jgi:hypothetical protein
VKHCRQTDRQVNTGHHCRQTDRQVNTVHHCRQTDRQVTTVYHWRQTDRHAINVHPSSLDQGSATKFGLRTIFFPASRWRARTLSKASSRN